MIQLAILLTRHHRLLSVAALLDVFETANRFYSLSGKEPYFHITLATPGTGAATDYAGYRTVPMAALPAQHAILIPAFTDVDFATAIKDNSEALHWLQARHTGGTEIASFCSGAFLLAASGLLNHRPATTHITAATAFSRHFPQVLLQSSDVTTYADGIYTSGGATNTFYLLLRLLEKFSGREMALRVAKFFAIDPDREQQAYFGTFQPVTSHSDELVHSLQQQIDSRYSTATSIEELMDTIPASRRNLVRRFKAATGNTPIAYLQKTRIEAAKRLLETTRQSMLEIMLSVGYNDQKSFRAVFQKQTGLTPKTYRDKFSTAVQPA